ncbi:MAG: 2'-5' RNA ligase family protein [Renibacterium salmoninarum]|nr:2'-5' RNA ligase family protein [Renibacterium salmoninarum]
MKRFFGVPMTQWDSMRDRLHVYVVPGAGLGAELARLQQSLRGRDYCAAQPVEFLHATVQQFAFTTGEAEAGLPEFACRMALLAARTTVFELQLGRPVVDDYSLGVRAEATDQWQNLSREIADAALGTCHAGRAMPAAPRQPHISLGYGIGTGSSSEIQSAVDALHTGNPPALAVAELKFVAVHQDESRGRYTWDELAAWPLAGP